MHSRTPAVQTVWDKMLCYPVLTNNDPEDSYIPILQESVIIGSKSSSGAAFLYRPALPPARTVVHVHSGVFLLVPAVAGCR